MHSIHSTTIIVTLFFLNSFVGVMILFEFVYHFFFFRTSISSQIFVSTVCFFSCVKEGAKKQHRKQTIKFNDMQTVKKCLSGKNCHWQNRFELLFFFALKKYAHTHCKQTHKHTQVHWYIGNMDFDCQSINWTKELSY